MSRTIEHMYLDYSSYSEYLKCPRKFAWSLIAQLIPKKSTDPTTGPLFKGTLVHECIDAAYQGKAWQDTFDALIPENSAILDLSHDRSGSVGHLEALIKEYMVLYNVPNDTDFSVTATEQRFEMPLTPWLTYCGTVDKVAKLKDSDEMVIIDHKTSSQLSRFMKPTIAVSDQFTGYIALARANGIDCCKLIVDGISTAHKALKEQEGLFERYTTVRTTEQIEEWRARIIKDAERMKEDIESSEFTSNQPAACNLFGSQCQFYNACATAGTSRTNILNNDFIQNPEPWKNFEVSWRNNE